MEFSRVQALTTGQPALFVDQEGGRVLEFNSPEWEQGNGGKFYDVTLFRNEELSPLGNPAEISIALTVRIRWPAYLPDGTQVQDDAAKRATIGNIVILR